MRGLELSRTTGRVSVSASGQIIGDSWIWYITHRAQGTNSVIEQRGRMMRANGIEHL